MRACPGQPPRGGSERSGSRPGILKARQLDAVQAETQEKLHPRPERGQRGEGAGSPSQAHRPIWAFVMCSCKAVPFRCFLYRKADTSLQASSRVMLNSQTDVSIQLREDQEAPLKVRSVQLGEKRKRCKDTEVVPLSNQYVYLPF